MSSARYSGLAAALLMLLLGAPLTGSAASSKLDVKGMLDWGWVQAQCTPLDIGQVSDVFDGDTTSLVRTPALNPLVLTLSFSETQVVDGFRLWFLGGTNRWEVEGADTLEDLEGQAPNTSYRLLVAPVLGPESQWNAAGPAAPAPVKLLRLTLYRMTGDGYVHLCEWEINHQISLDWSAGSGSSNQLRWATEPCGLYMLQSSDRLTNWNDQQYWLAYTSSISVATSQPGISSNAFYRVKRLSEPPERPYIERKVLVLNYDPLLTNHGGVRLHQYYHWNDPHLLNQQYLQDLSDASSNYVRWTVTQFLDLNEWPLKADGFRYTETSYLNAWATSTFHSPDAVDYLHIIQQFNLDDGARSGQFDEVVIWGAPYFGFYESQMAGAGAYWCNSPGISRPGTPKYVMMGLNYERGVAEAIHSFGHCVESIMTHVYGSWNSGTNAQHLWDKFTCLNKDAPGQAACGNVHFPPNGTSDYDYGNTNVVVSSADDWLLNFPNFTGLTRSFSAAEWNYDQRQYLNWWYRHLPHVPGRNADGKLNNWWCYLVDMNAYPESR